jgi:hypothetical protein
MISKSQYPALRHEQRIAAKKQARENLLNSLGGAPQLADFEARQFNRFSPQVERLLVVFLWLFLTASFVLSGVHVYFASKSAYGIGIHDPRLVIVAGLASVLITELAVIFFSAAPAVLEAVMTRSIAFLCYLLAALAGFLAVIGNVAVAIEYRESPFAWLRAWLNSFATRPMLFLLATLPPVMVVGAGLVLKTRILALNERHHRATTEFSQALAEFKHLQTNVEQHPEWPQFYASALWDQWRRGKAKTLLAEITEQDRRAIVRHEMLADRWGDVTGDVTDNVTVCDTDHGNVTARDNSESVTQMSQIDRIEMVRQHLTDNPEDTHKSLRELAEMLNVSYETIRRAKRSISSNGNHDDV